MQGFFQRHGAVDPIDLLSGSHDIGYIFVPELKNIGDHLGFIFQNGPLLMPLVDNVHDLFFIFIVIIVIRFPLCLIVLLTLGLIFAFRSNYVAEDGT